MSLAQFTLKSLRFYSKHRQHCLSRILFEFLIPVTKKAPEWETKGVINGSIKTLKSSDFDGKYWILFFYPLDFTFVCPTEIIAFSDRYEEFKKINCQVVAASIDSVFSHLAWINTPRNKGGLGKINFPILEDIQKTIASDYGALLDTGIALRGLFIMDPEGKVRHATLNDTPIGRSVDETIRLVQAIQYSDVNGEVCPANWKPGSKGMKADPNEAKGYFEDKYGNK